MTNEIQKAESPLAAAATLMQQSDGKIDVDKLEALLKVQMLWEANEAKKAYVQAMSDFKADPPEILKDKTVKYKDVKYSHSSLHNVTTCINKALSEHGLTASWVTSQDNGGIKVACKITHIQGHSEETSLSAPPDQTGSKNPIQAIGSTVTYLQRYTLLALTGLATHDQDDDGKGADKKDTLPAKPTADQDKILTAICKILANKTKKAVDKKRVAGLFLSEFNKYPDNLDVVKQVADWIVSLNRQDEWTEQPKKQRKPQERPDDPFPLYCISCGRNLSAGTTKCPGCQSEEIVPMPEPEPEKSALDKCISGEFFDFAKARRNDLAAGFHYSEEKFTAAIFVAIIKAGVDPNNWSQSEIKDLVAKIDTNDVIVEEEI